MKLLFVIILVLSFCIATTKSTMELKDAFLAMAAEIETLQVRWDSRHEQLQNTMDATNDALHGVLSSILEKITAILVGFNLVASSTTTPTISLSSIFHVGPDGSIQVW